MQQFLLMPYTLACTVAALQGFGQHSAVIGSAFIAANKSEIIGQTCVTHHPSPITLIAYKVQQICSHIHIFPPKNATEVDLKYFTVYRS